MGFEKVIEHLNNEHTEKYNKLKWLKDSDRSGDAVDELNIYCNQLEKAIGFLEDAPTKMENLEAEVEKLNNFKEVVKTIVGVMEESEKINENVSNKWRGSV